MWYGIDFGTSNSLMTFVSGKDAPRLIQLENNTPILKSLIFTPDRAEYYFGAEAIIRYQEMGGEGRFFRSLKKFLPEPSFKGTEIFGKMFKIEDLIAILLREMKKRADDLVGYQVENVVLGRPALYSLDPEKDQLAEVRMRKAAELAGFKRIEFCAEPIAAGLNSDDLPDELNDDSDDSHNYSDEKLILVCDFGGGTSDFTLFKSGQKEFNPSHVLGLAGVFIAGDAIDGRIMRDYVSSQFGKDIKYKIPMGQNVLTFPRQLITKLCNPAHIAFLKERNTWEFLKELEQWVLEGEDARHISQLFCLVEEDLGYSVYSEIEKSKIALGNEPKSIFQYKHSAIDIEMTLIRQKFEDSISKELGQIFQSLEKTFEQSGKKISDVDEVWITGGTGQMPLVQNKLIDMFGEHKLKMNDAFQSVALGLGNYAKQFLT